MLLKSVGLEEGNISYVPDKYSEALYVLKTEPRNSLQRDAISFIIGEGSYENTKKYSQLSLVLETGEELTSLIELFPSNVKTSL